MNKSIRNAIIIVVPIILIPFLFFKSCVIQNPQPEDSEIIDVKITQIKEGSTYDILFETDKGNRYYINRGLQQGLNLETLNAKVLNKTVTLHLPILMFGPSNHIAQLAIGGDVIFTEFSNID